MDNTPTREELKKLNDFSQVILRLHYMTNRMPNLAPAKQDTSLCWREMVAVADRMGLNQIDCDCHTNQHGGGDTRTCGFVPRKRGYIFECVHCGRWWTYNSLVDMIQQVPSFRDGEMCTIDTAGSSWIKSIKGTWDRSLCRVEDVVVNNGEDGYKYDFIPLDTWNGWRKSSSKGKFFHKHVRQGADGRKGW